MYPDVTQWITQGTEARGDSSRPTRSGGQTETVLTNARSARLQFDKDDLHPSVELARELISVGIQGLVFPSAVGSDDNLVVYRVKCGRKALSPQNEREAIDQIRRIAGRHR
jgi:hypothetical protein